MTQKTYTVGGVEMPRPFKLRRFGHWGSFHQDLDAARTFYIDQLGFRVTDELKGPPGAPSFGFFASHCGDHHATAAINAMLAAADPTFTPGVLINQLSFQVGSLEEVVRGHEYFAGLGLKVWRVGRDSPGSNWAVYAQDPDGHLAELYYGMEQVGWDRRSKPKSAQMGLHESPTLPQPSERQELAAVEARGESLEGGFRPEEPLPYRYDVGGVTLQRPFKINRVGPVYLWVKDVARSQAFYQDVMGMQFTEEVKWNGHRAVFLRCGNDHHVIALFPVAARAELKWPGDSTTMCLGIEVCSYQQLRDARSFLIEQGMQQGQVLPAELHPGIDHAAFFVDPAGQTVMLYFSMEQVGWDGRPRPASERRRIGTDWPASIADASDTFADQLLQGPLG